jgi:uncharacterized membrane protein
MKVSTDWFVIAAGAIGTLIATMVLWQFPFPLILVLVLLSLGMISYLKKKRLIVIYFFGFFFGPLTEAASIYTGAWHYTAPDILGFPFWLPFVWGSASVVIAATYEVIDRRKTIP